LCVLEIRNLLPKDISLFNKLQRQVKRQMSLRKIRLNKNKTVLNQYFERIAPPKLPQGRVQLDSLRTSVVDFYIV